MKSRKTKPQMKKTQTDDVSTDEVLECLKALRKAVRKKPNKKARINDVPTVEVTVEYLEALRKEVGRHIDPDTAEVDWVYAQVLDPTVMLVTCRRSSNRLGEITSLVRPEAICGSGFTTCPTPLLIGCWKNTNTSWPFQQDFRAPSNRVAALVARFELRAWARIFESGLILGAAFINHQHYRSALVFAGSLD